MAGSCIAAIHCGEPDCRPIFNGGLRHDGLSEASLYHVLERCTCEEELGCSFAGDQALRELPSPGKSGSVFFLSADDKFIIKTMRKVTIPAGG